MWVFDGGTQWVGAGETLWVSSLPLFSLGKTSSKKTRAGRRGAGRGANPPPPSSCTRHPVHGQGHLSWVHLGNGKYQGIFDLLFHVFSPCPPSQKSEMVRSTPGLLLSDFWLDLAHGEPPSEIGEKEGGRAESELRVLTLPSPSLLLAVVCMPP